MKSIRISEKVWIPNEDYAHINFVGLLIGPRANTLKALQEKLQSNVFQRVHRNALVNVNHVRKMSALSSQRWLLTLDNNQEFIVSKRQAKTVREILSW